MLDNEEVLIFQAKNGDKDSFRQLYEHYIGPIFRFIFLKVSDRNAAEDITHEVFLSSWRNLHSYQSRGLPFSSWLYRIARNKVIDHYRTKKNNIRIDDLNEYSLGVIDKLDDDVDRSLSIERVKKCFDKLSPDQKDVTIMRFIEELSHREIARALGKAKGRYA